MKYQVSIDATTLRPFHVAGPYFGKIHDATVWKECSLAEYLRENDLFLLGDKGYAGCQQVYSMKKKKRGQQTLSTADKEYNAKIAEVRVRVENHFADLKKWKVLSHVFRGNVESHRKVFIACEFLTLLSKS